MSLGPLNKQRKRAKKKKLAARCGCKCTYCGKGMALEHLTLDHVIPVCRGGSHDLSNLCLACRPCNTRKSDKLPHVWHAELCGVAA